MPAVISAVMTADYSLETVTQAVRTHFHRFPLEKKLHAGVAVVIKPNLLLRRKPEEFTTTHPSLVEAAIICLKEYGVTDITLAESPGGLYNEAALRSIYEGCGMTEVCRHQGVKLNFDVTSVECHRAENHLVKSFPIITPVAHAPFLLEICKLKTHAMTGMSGAVKNLFGTIPGLTKPEFHWRFPEQERFCEMLLDLSQTVHPDFALVDAVESMEGNGPSGGTVRRTNVTFASDQIYELDSFLASFIGSSADEIPTVRLAVQRGLCTGDASGYEVKGAYLPVHPFVMPDTKSLDFMSHTPKPLRRPLKWVTTHFLTSRPVIRTKDCIGCGKCAESCPAKTIRIVRRKAVIDAKNCIHCFCCHEMCPKRAIDVKQAVFFHRAEGK